MGGRYTIGGEHEGAEQVRERATSEEPITEHKGNRVSYLGLDIAKQEDGGYVVSSPGTRQSILHKFGHLDTCKKGPVTPMA